jgi:hypothetical protein
MSDGVSTDLWFGSHTKSGFTRRGASISKQKPPNVCCVQPDATMPKNPENWGTRTGSTGAAGCWALYSRNAKEFDSHPPCKCSVGTCRFMCAPLAAVTLPLQTVGHKDVKIPQTVLQIYKWCSGESQTVWGQSSAARGSDINAGDDHKSQVCMLQIVRKLRV